MTSTDLSAPITTSVALPSGGTSATATLVVPAGSNRSLKVEAVNGNGKVVAATTVTGIAVISGQNTPVNAVLAINVGTVSGKVVDQTTGLGVPGLNVSADSKTTAMTDGSGNFTLPDVTAGPATLTFSSSAYANATAQVLVTAGTNASAGTTALVRLHWVPVISGNSNDLTSVVVRSATEAWVTGKNGTLLHTTDGGNSWGQVSLGTTSHVHRVAFADASIGFAAASYPAGAYKTTNGGATWTKMLGSLTSDADDLGVVSSQSVAILDGGSLYWTFDGGTSSSNYSNWIGSSTVVYLSELLVSSSTQLWGAKKGATQIYRNGAGGATSWQSVAIPLTTDGEMPLAATSANVACVAGHVSVTQTSTNPLGQQTSETINRASLACTQTSGAGWATAFTSTASSSDALQGVGAWGSGFCGVGTDGLIVMLPAGAGSASVSPIAVSDPKNYRLNAVGFYGTTVGFAVGDSGVILRY